MLWLMRYTPVDQHGYLWITNPSYQLAAGGQYTVREVYNGRLDGRACAVGTASVLVLNGPLDGCRVVSDAISFGPIVLYVSPDFVGRIPAALLVMLPLPSGLGWKRDADESESVL